MLVWPLLTLFACSPRDVEPDAARYTRLVSMAAPTADDIRDCAGLSDPDLRGDCALVTAQNAARAAGVLPETFCPQIDAPAWQSECYFMAAEAYNNERAYPQAAEMCLRATLFTNHCAQHLWQKPLAALTYKDGAAAFAPRLADAKRLHQRWAPLLDEHTDFTARFWRRYFEGGFERSRRIDLDACASLPEEDARRCQEAGASLFSRRLLDAIQFPRGHELVCAAEATTAAVVRIGPPQLRASPHPELDAGVARFQQTYCQGGRPLAGSTDGLPLDPAP